ncbi:MAG: hypothetical protein NTX73_17705 [Rhodobacterales bacterium]|jgi:hypothetical protein|nr:hypothetical protein [Rhodobacterales bacterium]
MSRADAVIGVKRYLALVAQNGLPVIMAAYEDQMVLLPNGWCRMRSVRCRTGTMRRSRISMVIRTIPIRRGGTCPLQ